MAYKLSDPEFVDKIILEVKSQGIFDGFRKECLADVDTQPAFQNLHSRVEDTVQRFLNRQVWTPEIKNKNRIREEMRMNIIRAGFLESGVSRIVDQVVEQKMDYIQSKVEDILYKYVGIEKPKKTEKPNGALEVDTTDLLPTDLEQVSPDSSSDKKSSGSIKEEIEEEIIEDEEDFESPAFEPLVPNEPIKTEKEEHESQNTNLSEISSQEISSRDSAKSHKSEPTVVDEANKVDTALSQISSTQDIPDTTNETPVVNNLASQVSGIIGEEAQMATGLNDSSENESKLIDATEKCVEEPKCQFDLKKDTIEFTGTERKPITLDDSTNSGESEKVIKPEDVQNMEVDNFFENDTTDSSEMRMEIDLKDESTQETATSSKVEESSQDSLKNKDKDKDKHHKYDRSSKSSHKSSRHHHHGSSSKSKHDDSNSRYKSHKSSSSHKKGSSDRDRSSSSRRDKDRDKDRKSESSKSREIKKQDEKKLNDDHHQEKSSSRRRRSTDHDSNDSKELKKSNNPSNNNNNNADEKWKKETETTEKDKSVGNEQQQKSTENKPVIIDQILSKSCEVSLDPMKIQPNKTKEQKSSILIKYDYLKPAKKSITKDSDNDDEMNGGFRGFEMDELPDNPWFECIRLMQLKKYPFVSNNNYISKKQDESISQASSKKAVKTKSKTTDQGKIITSKKISKVSDTHAT